MRGQADSPAVLSYISSVFKALIKVMRLAFQRGLGPLRLSKVQRIPHKEKYVKHQL